MYQCRICLDDCERSEVIAPCKCKGSSRWVHRECLDRWRSTREDKAFSKCTECLSQYRFINPNEQNENSNSCSSNTLFMCLVGRDVAIILVIVSIIVAGLSSLVYELDSKSSLLVNFFHMNRFYVVCII